MRDDRFIVLFGFVILPLAIFAVVVGIPVLDHLLH